MRSKRWFLLAGSAAVIALVASPAWHKAVAQGISGGQGERTGAVTTIDAVGKSFGCHWQTQDWTYTTTDDTAFLVDKKEAAFADLKVGAMVRVTYHVVDKTWIADKVVITP